LQMNVDRRREISAFAANLRKALKLPTPIDTELAVRRLGGTVIVDPSLEYEAMVEKVGNGFRILLSADKVSEGRRKFSVAHELGHLFLHMGYLVDQNRWHSIRSYRDSVRYRYGYSEEEFEANEFAAAFLMPKDDFERIARQYYCTSAYDVNSIAKEFGVSRDAATNRGRWSNMFSWG
jgi:predicted transcriptional regulator